MFQKGGKGLMMFTETFTYSENQLNLTNKVFVGKMLCHLMLKKHSYHSLVKD